MEQQSATRGQNGPNDQKAYVLDLGQVFRSVKSAVAEDWKRVLGIAFLFALIATAASFAITPMYKATVVVQVKGKDSKGLGGASSPLADLAVAAGVPPLADESADAAIGKLKSTTFARGFIEKEKLTDSLLRDQSLLLSRWISLSELMPGSTPTGISAEYRKLERARIVFSEKRISFSEDRRTKLLTLDLYWDDPVRAAELANKMIREVNEYMRKQAIETSRKSVDYLNVELSKTSIVPVQQAVFRLMEDQVKTQMTAGVSEEFSLRFIDPASPPTQRDSPKRALIALLAALVGFFLSIVVLYRKRKTVVVN